MENETSDNTIAPMFRLAWILMTGLLAAVSNLLKDIDIVLGIITKIIPIISFILFLIINYEVIIKNSKKILNTIFKR